MTDRGDGEPGLVLPPAPRLRGGRGASAWISLVLFIAAVAALLYALAVGAYGGFLVACFATVVLFFPTVILMAVWIEVRIDNRRALERHETEWRHATSSARRMRDAG